MVIFVRVQGRRKFQPQEYIEYFEDWNLSLSKRSVDPAHRGRRNRAKSAVLQRSRSVTDFYWRFRVPETCSLPYQISYAMKFERSLSMRPGAHNRINALIELQ